MCWAWLGDPACNERRATSDERPVALCDTEWPALGQIVKLNGSRHRECNERPDWDKPQSVISELDWEPQP